MFDAPAGESKPDPTKKFQVAVFDWDGHRLQGLKKMADYYKDSVLSVSHIVEPLPHMLPFDKLEEAREMYRLLKAEGVKAEAIGFETEEP